MSAYRDSDGDVWTQQEDGRYASLGYLDGCVFMLLREVDEQFGPLTELHEETETVDIEALSATATAIERTEALKIATEHVNSLATNARGYQDGVRFADKVAAVERLARFLMGEGAPDA